MQTIKRIVQGLSLLLPLSLQAEVLPPPGGPYPSTVPGQEPAPAIAPEPEQLRFPPPDLVAPAPPPPSLSEELGPDFADTGVSAPTESTGEGTAQTPSPAPDYAAPSPAYGASGNGYPPAIVTPTPPTPPTSSWPGYAPGYSQTPGADWPGQPSSAYPGYGWGSYPYGYTAPGYGYGYPDSTYGNNWNDRVPTPFGNMPAPWDAMPNSFFPGR